MNSITNLYQAIETQNLWEKTIHLKRNTNLAEPFINNSNLYYVVSGCVVVYKEEDPVEQIIRFGYESSFICCLDSFLNNEVSEFGIRAIKETHVKCITKSVFFDLINSSSVYQKLWIEILNQLVLQCIDREKDLLTSSPEARYLRVLKRSPQLFQQVPHKYIASYLRMSPETLSRLKKS